MERLKNPKLIAALIVVALAVIVFLQNNTPVELKMLWVANVSTTLSLAMLATFVAGVATGALAFSRWKSQRDKARSTGAAPSA